MTADYNHLEQEITKKYRRKEKSKTVKMKVSGRRALTLKKIIESKVSK